MNERKNNMNEMKIGYNVCPHCGRYPYETMDDYDVYRVGCAYCGLNSGVITFLEEPINDAVKDETRREWNRKCLSVSIADDVLACLGAEEDDLVITWRHDDMIECVARDVDTLLRVIGDHENLFNVYQVKENHLEFLGTSKLVSILTPKY